MENNRNTILAMALSMLVLVGWMVLVDGPRRAEEQARRAEQQAQQAQTDQTGQTGAGSVPAPGTAGDNVPAPQAPAGTGPDGTATGGQSAAAPGNIPGSAAVTPGQDRADVLAQSQRVKIETPALIGSISLTGGRIDDLLLKKYRETTDPSSPLIELYSPLGTDDPYYAEFGWVARGVKTPAADSLWTSDSDVLTPSQPVTLSWDNDEGLIFRRTISVDDDYKFTLAQSVENTTGEDVTLFPYGLVNRVGQPKVAGFFV
ncbi:MAG TPA: membrane protein insertase YidC, partial [Afifellaceae bacterium]|nr:membrane protein insertase YidC [Afifellaceae bacterium]